MSKPYGMVLGANGDTPLYVGGMSFMMDVQLLVDIRLGCIVSCLPWAPEGILDVLRALGVHLSDFRVYHLEDSRDSFVSLLECPDVIATIDFIHARRLCNKPTMVHCDGGITRSPSVCVAYVMKYGVNLMEPAPMSFAAASQIVRAAREKMDLIIFMHELRLLETEFNRSTGVAQLGTLTWSSPPLLSRFATSRLQNCFNEALRTYGGHGKLADAFHANWAAPPKRYVDTPASVTKALAMDVVLQLGKTLMAGMAEMHELCAIVTGHPYLHVLDHESFLDALCRTFGDTFGDWGQFVCVMQQRWTGYPPDCPTGRSSGARRSHDHTSRNSSLITNSDVSSFFSMSSHAATGAENSPRHSLVWTDETDFKDRQRKKSLRKKSLGAPAFDPAWHAPVPPTWNPNAGAAPLTMHAAENPSPRNVTWVSVSNNPT